MPGTSRRPSGSVAFDRPFDGKATCAQRGPRGRHGRGPDRSRPGWFDHALWRLYATYALDSVKRDSSRSAGQVVGSDTRCDGSDPLWATAPTPRARASSRRYPGA